MIRSGVDITVLYKGKKYDAETLSYDNGHYLVYIYELKKKIIIHCKDILEVLS